MSVQSFPSYHISPASRLEEKEARFGLAATELPGAIRRAVVYTLVAYLPFVFAAVFERVRVGTWDPRIWAIDTHVRALIALPILLLAEHVVDVRGRSATAYLVEANIVEGEARQRYEAITSRIARLRDSNLAEFTMLALAVASSLIHVRVPIGGLTTPINGLGTAIMLSLFRFVLLRWLWCWGLWSVLLARVSRLPLRLTATHPDRMGGLGPLLAPSEAFAMVAAGGSAAIASSWANRIVYTKATIDVFQPAAIGYVVIMLLLAALPLGSFSGVLYRVRREGLVYYGAFVQRFAAAFEAWSHDRFGSRSLDAPQISALADLGTAYERVGEMKPTMLASRRLILAMVAGCLAPMLPLLLLERRVPELLIGLLKALTAGA